jgi:hypothetical protein
MPASSAEHQAVALALGLSGLGWIRESYDADPVMSVAVFGTGIYVWTRMIDLTLESDHPFHSS